MTAATRVPPSVRSWPRAAWLAMATLWLPTFVPFVLGPLRECDHCVATYAMCMPMVPGVIVPALFSVPGVWFFVVGGLVALVCASGLAVALRELPRPWSLGVQGIVALAVAFEAVGFANLLRM